MNELVDIVVTVYNKENTLKRCIDSILSQEYEHFNLIIIDDGSTDNSQKICQGYDDGRIRYYYQTNSGVGNARNSGINRIEGSKLVFIDADDFVSSSFLSSLMNHKNYDLVVQGYTLCMENGKPKQIRLPKECLVTSENFGKRLFIKEVYEFMTMPWNKLFDTRIIKDNNISFRNITTGEDVCFVFDYLQYANNVLLTCEHSYNYILSENSLTRKPIPDIWERKRDINNYCRKNYYALYSETWTSLYISSIKRTLAESCNDRERFNMQIQKIRSDVDFSKVNETYLSSTIDKILYVFLKLNNTIILWIMFRFV